MDRNQVRCGERTTDKETMNRVMVDIETLGIETGSVILSIGAVRFDENGTYGDPFYVEIDRTSCENHGLQTDPDTLDWWQSEHPEVAPLNGEVSLTTALERFSDWLNSGLDEIWANSPSFDCEQLEHAYAQVGKEEPWEYYYERDVRTIREVFGIELEQDSDEHHALDDAEYQAEIVAEALQDIEQ